MKLILFAAVLLLAVVSAEVHYKEEFGAGWDSRWVQSSHKKASGEAGKYGVSAGKFYGDVVADAGLETQEDARFYALSSKIATPFSNMGKDLVLQFSVKHAQNIDCGGGYIKLMPSTVDQAKFNGDSPYSIMFGPDICGQTKRIHAIITYKGKNHLIKQDIPCETDEFTHVYTLIIRPDQTFDIRVDGNSKKSGSIIEEWDILPAKKIKDSSVSKPKDWVDESLIDDAEDTKPDGYDDVPRQVIDSDSEKPEDWDDEADGEWEAPMIDNPEYKGEWKAKKIANPAYKGVWEHPMIDNPDYVLDDSIYAFSDIGMVSFELWQVKSGTIFDNIIVTDSVEEAEKFMSETFSKNIAAEKEMKNAPAASASAPAAEEDDEEDEDEAEEHDEL